MKNVLGLALLLSGVLACGGAAPAVVAPTAAVPPSAEPPPRSPTEPAPLAVSLPGGTGPADLDYMLVDRAAGKVWVPAGARGNVAVIDAKTLDVQHVDGFTTSTRTLANHSFTLGPTAIAMGEGVAYVGSRGDNRICLVNASKLAKGACVELGAPDDLAAAADGMAYVRSARELWVTRGAPTLGVMPPDSSILVFDASDAAALKPKGKVEVPGAAEGYAVDDAHGVFYTNVVDKDLTLAIDVRAHRVRSTWRPQCGKDGPRGLGVDSARSVVFVACTDHVVALDAAHDGAMLASAPVGEGIDNVDYVESRHELYVAAGKAAKLAVLRFEDGKFVPVQTVATARGARVVVADDAGTAFVGDPYGGQILVVRALAGASPAPSPAPAASAPAPLDVGRVGALTGAKPDTSGNVVKVSFPRDDAKVEVDGWKMPPFMGLTSWAAFVPGEKPDVEAMVMGDLVLLEDEVEPTMSAALESGLEVTALHNHFFYDKPHVYFMHIGGEGALEKLGKGVKAALDAQRAVRSKAKGPAAAFGPPLPAGRSSIDAAKLDAVFGVKGASKDGMYKATMDRSARAACGCTIGKAMGVNTWAAFSGTEDNAVADGDFAVAEGELQGVLKSLRGAGINVVAIHSHMTGESPRLLFLHYWGRGRALDVARSIKQALDLTDWEGRAQSQ